MTKRIFFYIAFALISIFSVNAAYAQSSETIWRVFASNQWFESPMNSTVCSNSIQAMQERTNADPSSPNIYVYSFQQLSSVVNGRATCIGNYTIATRKDGKVFASETNQNLINIESVTCSGATPKYNYTTHSCGTESGQNPCADKNEFIRRWNYPNGGSSAPDHFGECVIETIKMLVCRKDTVTYCMWLVRRTGAKYSGPSDGGGGNGSDQPDNPKAPPVNSPPIKPPPGGSCPTGTVNAGVDSGGIPICMGTGSDPKNSPPPPPKITSEKTTTNADGSVTKTTTTTTTNSDGSTTTVTNNVTTMPDGSTKTDTGKDTSKTPTGEAGKDDSGKDDEKYDLCKQNPMLTICRNSSVSGTCGEIACQGDAIQCATLRAAAALECRSKKQEEDFLKRPEIAAGQQILDGNDPMKGAIDTALKGQTVDFGATSLDQSGFLGGGSCLAPKSFSAFGQRISINFDSMCSNIQPLRFFVMACAFILAYLIISRAALES